LAYEKTRFFFGYLERKLYFCTRKLKKPNILAYENDKENVDVTIGIVLHDCNYGTGQW
jgi:hypothetical protein